MNLMVTTANQQQIRPDEWTTLDLSIQLVLRHELSAVGTKHAQGAAIVSDKDAAVIDEWCSVGWSGQFDSPDNLTRFGIKLPESAACSRHKESTLRGDRGSVVTDFIEILLPEKLAKRIVSDDQPFPTYDGNPLRQNNRGPQ